MLSQIPENALVTLLRRCYIAPRCQALRQCARRTPLRTLHILPSCQNLRLRHSENQHGRSDLRDGGRSYGLSHKQIRPILSTELQRDNVQKRTLSTKARHSNSTPEPNRKESGPDRIAVLGGGITGLASAHYLAKALPNAKIDIYEGSERLGGWLNSKRFDVGNGSVVFEQGPRTLRPQTPAGMLTVQMVRDLGLEEELLVTYADSVAAQNRFVYYPDHLVRMPGPGQDIFQILWSLLTEPIYAGLWNTLLEPRRPVRSPALDDESVGSFLERRLGSSQLGDNVVSAVLHGIYAGNLNKLSIKSLVPDLWYSEVHYGSLFKAFAEKARSRAKIMTTQDSHLARAMRHNMVGTPIADTMRNASVYTFRKGISALLEALETSLKGNRKVTFKLGHKINSVQHDNTTDRIKIKTTQNQPEAAYANVIATISGRNLSYLTKEADDLPSLQAIEAVTVMVVNLYYRDPDLLPERGFGYLIPRSIPYEQNPECALGVVFDSDSSIGQDEVPGTKLTVMLGGHWWDGFDSYPDKEEGEAMAKAVLKRHLGIDVEPHMVNVGLQKDCIPQYTVGHEARMKSAHDELMRTFKGRLTVAGNSYTGVGLNDCIRSARDVVFELCEMSEPDVRTPDEEYVKAVVQPQRVLGDLKRSTGLEKFLLTDRWAGFRISNGRPELMIAPTQKGVTDLYREHDSR